MSVAKAIAGYVANDDPLARACNVIALVVAANQPFYPLYVVGLIGGGLAPAMLTLLSTPFFLVVPLLARRNARWGRALLPVAGMANTVLATKIFGQAAGVELFLMPCLLIAAAFFRPSERMLAIALGALGFGIYVGLDGRYGEPICGCSPADQQALLGLHALSVAALIVLIGLLSRDSRPSLPSR
jgi:hypothetical protein